LASTMVTMGLWPLAAHMFIFYFANLSGLTPPVCLAAYAAAGIAGSKPMATGFAACRLGIALVILPYFFCYQTGLLMHGSTLEIIHAVIFAVVGILSIAASVEGWLMGYCNWVIRVFLAAGALLFICPSWRNDIIGMGLILFSVGYQMLKYRKVASGGVTEITR